jgi:hypothetical protein
MEEKRIAKEKRENKKLRAAIFIREAHKFLMVKKVIDAFHSEKEHRIFMFKTVFVVNIIKGKMLRKLKKLKPNIEQRNGLLVTNCCTAGAGTILHRLAKKEAARVMFEFLDKAAMIEYTIIAMHDTFNKLISI